MTMKSGLNFLLAFPLLLLILGVGASPCFSESTDDLFTFDNSRWMTLDHYKESKKPFSVTSPQSASPKEDQGREKVVTEKPSQALPSMINQETNTTQGHKTKGIETAEPSRPLNLPELPGTNKGYNVSVSSTLEENGSGAHLSNIDTSPDLTFRDENWQPATDVSQHNSDLEIPNLNIRMTYLPNPEIRPVPSFQRDPYRTRMLERQKSLQSPDDKAAAAALEAFKKKQLEAIQSDRQTLESLQNAITKLGLQKDLSFIPSSGTTLDAASTAGTSGGPSIKSP